MDSKKQKSEDRHPILLEDENPLIDRLFLFVSFDLAGSTKLKENVSTPIEWVTMNKEFFLDVMYQMDDFCRDGEKYERFSAWKYIGDEVLYYLEVKSWQEIGRATSFIYDVTDRVSDYLRSSGYDLDVKTTAWLAFIQDKGSNVFFNLPFLVDDRVRYVKDFFGQAMDEGFRISKAFARPRRLTLSFDLARSLLKTKIYGECYCVGFERLKGIWKGRGYPALWFSKDLIGDRDDVSYDEHLDCELIKQFVNLKGNGEQSSFYEKIVDECDVIVKETSKKIDDYLTQLNQSPQA